MTFGHSYNCTIESGANLRNICKLFILIAWSWWCNHDRAKHNTIVLIYIIDVDRRFPKLNLSNIPCPWITANTFNRILIKVIELPNLMWWHPQEIPSRNRSNVIWFVSSPIGLDPGKHEYPRHVLKQRTLHYDTYGCKSIARIMWRCNI